MDALYRPGTATYLQTLRAGLKQGRLFDARDIKGAQNVLVVNETFARRHFPNGDAANDAPAALEINGKVIIEASPFSGTFSPPSNFYEWTGTVLSAFPAPPNAVNTPSFVGHLLLLPNGQIMYTDFSTDVEFLTSTGTFNSAWRPTIKTVATTRVGTQWRIANIITLEADLARGLGAGTISLHGTGEEATRFVGKPVEAVTHDHLVVRLGEVHHRPLELDCHRGNLPGDIGFIPRRAGRYRARDDDGKPARRSTGDHQPARAPRLPRARHVGVRDHARRARGEVAP
jgi:hypothetical protein